MTATETPIETETEQEAPDYSASLLRRVFLPAKELAEAWKDVWGACADEDAGPTAYRKVFVEWHNDGVQLVTAATGLLLRTWVPALGSDGFQRGVDLYADKKTGQFAGPLAGTAKLRKGQEATLVCDDDALSPKMMNHLAAKATAHSKDHEDELGVWLELHAGAEDVSQLFPEQARRTVHVVTSSGYRLPMYVWESGWTDWRLSYTEEDPAEIEGPPTLYTATLKALAKIKTRIVLDQVAPYRWFIAEGPVLGVIGVRPPFELRPDYEPETPAEAVTEALQTGKGDLRLVSERFTADELEAAEVQAMEDGD